MEHLSLAECQALFWVNDMVTKLDPTCKCGKKKCYNGDGKNARYEFEFDGTNYNVCSKECALAIVTARIQEW